MSEIAEAVQILELPIQAFGSLGSIFLQTTQLGVSIARAIAAQIRESQKKNLHGEVTMEKMVRWNGNDLHVARFEEVKEEALKDILDRYDVPYVKMPDTEVNGVKLVQVTFPDSHRDRMCAVIQHFEGKGEIIDQNTIPPMIYCGEVSLKALLEQDGMNPMVYQFAEADMETVHRILVDSGMKFAVLPDLNLGDGLAEVAYPAAQHMLMDSVMKRYAKGRIMGIGDYVKNADPEEIKKKEEQKDKEQMVPVGEMIRVHTPEEMEQMMPAEIIKKEDGIKGMTV